ncbi:hypothetical protein [Bradyrhizobium sp. ARR65]|uniref:hypothetical protein n=1 Tax=Bradyrhizobium sp. ARR65 TaxID=1040989 RepID=UPI000AEAE3FE|nr:hypothetical protein [Bradyrhizobium sp. ARR65]
MDAQSLARMDRLGDRPILANVSDDSAYQKEMLPPIEAKKPKEAATKKTTVELQRKSA